MLSLAKVSLTLLGKQGDELGWFARGCNFSWVGWGQRTPAAVGWGQRSPMPAVWDGTLSATALSTLRRCPGTGIKLLMPLLGLKPGCVTAEVFTLVMQFGFLRQTHAQWIPILIFYWNHKAGMTFPSPGKCMLSNGESLPTHTCGSLGDEDWEERTPQHLAGLLQSLYLPFAASAASHSNCCCNLWQLRVKRTLPCPGMRYSGCSTKPGFGIHTRPAVWYQHKLTLLTMLTLQGHNCQCWHLWCCVF